MRPSAEDEAPQPGTRRSRAARMARRAVIDLTPLRTSREFRLLWFGELVSHTGRHITVVALPFQVWELTRSTLAVGLIGLVQVMPLMAGSILGGALADAMDRRRLLLITQSALVVTGLLFVWLAAMGDPPVALLYVAAALNAALTAVDAPARTSAIPGLVGKENLPSAMALNQVLMQVSDVAGPALGGLIIARFGLVWAYSADVASFLVAILALLAMRPMPPRREEGEAVPRRLQAIRDGFRYLRGRPVLQTTFTADIIAMVFGMPRALFPVLADEVFRVGPQGLGLLFAAPAAGALVGALFTGWVRHVRHQGRAVLWAIAVWGLAIAAFGLSTEAFWLGLVFLAVAGAADVVSAIFRSTILQGTVPDSLRGRLSSIHFMVVVGGPRLGDVEAGVVAHLTSPVFSVISGGAACVIGVGLLALLVPAFRRYHAGEPA
ncbi:MAG TPA: MFS transporter [Actinomycetota bacterium]|nr:MFS transporter [Actinomycetota bacterium]